MRSPMRFGGFMDDPGQFVSTSVAHAMCKIIPSLGGQFRVLVNCGSFMFKDEIYPDWPSIPVLRTSRLDRLIDTMERQYQEGQKDKPPPDAALLGIFCEELVATTDPALVGREAIIVFVYYSTQKLAVFLPRRLKENLMHEASLRLLESALEDFEAQTPHVVRVLDVGSLDLNGTYRPLIEERGWQYTGLDIEHGPNVDVVTDNPYHYPLDTGSFDLVITGSTAYAVLDLVSWTKELARVLAPDGRLIIITPSLSKPPTTASPADLWRMTDVALQMLLENTGLLEDIKVETHHMDVLAVATRVHGLVDEPTVMEAVVEATPVRKPAAKKSTRR